MKETVELEQTEQGRRQKERSIIQVDEGEQRHIHPAEERIINYPSIPQSQQMEPNGISASNSRKSEKSPSSLDQRTQPQSFQVSTGQPEVHRYTTVYEIGDKR